MKVSTNSNAASTVNRIRRTRNWHQSASNPRNLYNVGERYGPNIENWGPIENIFEDIPIHDPDLYEDDQFDDQDIRRTAFWLTCELNFFEFDETRYSKQILTSPETKLSKLANYGLMLVKRFGKDMEYSSNLTEKQVNNDLWHGKGDYYVSEMTSNIYHSKQSIGALYHRGFYIDQSPGSDFLWDQSMSKLNIVHDKLSCNNKGDCLAIEEKTKCLFFSSREGRQVGHIKSTDINTYQYHHLFDGGYFWYYVDYLGHLCNNDVRESYPQNQNRNKLTWRYIDIDVNNEGMIWIIAQSCWQNYSEPCNCTKTVENPIPCVYLYYQWEIEGLKSIIYGQHYRDAYGYGTKDESKNLFKLKRFDSSGLTESPVEVVSIGKNVAYFSNYGTKCIYKIESQVDEPVNNNVLFVGLDTRVIQNEKLS